MFYISKNKGRDWVGDPKDIIQLNTVSFWPIYRKHVFFICVIAVYWTKFLFPLTGCPSLGFYGERCSLECHKNCFCHIIDGNCLGCIPGYYGDNCSLECPQNCQKGHCHNTEGTCLECEPGYIGATCTQGI